MTVLEQLGAILEQARAETLAAMRNCGATDYDIAVEMPRIVRAETDARWKALALMREMIAAAQDTPT